MEEQLQNTVLFVKSHGGSVLAFEDGACHHEPVRICVIFNPAAKGGRARRFKRGLADLQARCELKATGAEGDARRLAAEAVENGFETIVAAGGDGTVNEVVNGIGDARGGFDRARLGVLPLGTVNVFARELGLALRLESAWQTILSGQERRIDLGVVECMPMSAPVANGETKPPGGKPATIAGRPVLRRYFVQMAGAGLDARAVQLVEMSVKKRIGPLAYVVAGMKALRIEPSEMTATDGSQAASGQLVLFGNGQRYGGEFRLFPAADLKDGLIDVCVFKRANWWTVARCAPSLLLFHRAPAGATECFQSREVELSSPSPTPLEVDGELAGMLPARFSVEKARLRVVGPLSRRLQDNVQTTD